MGLARPHSIVGFPYVAGARWALGRLTFRCASHAHTNARRAGSTSGTICVSWKRWVDATGDPPKRSHRADGDERDSSVVDDELELLTRLQPERLPNVERDHDLELG